MAWGPIQLLTINMILSRKRKVIYLIASIGIIFCINNGCTNYEIISESNDINLYSKSVRTPADMTIMAIDKLEEFDNHLFDIEMNYFRYAEIIEPGNFSAYELNASVSNVTPLRRYMQDYRNKLCMNVKYPESNDTVSVVIPFHNELWSMLLRTVISVLQQTPAEYLKEIILIDDASDIAVLKTPMDIFVRVFPIVKLFRFT